MQICEETEPPLVEVEDGHHMRCHIPIEELRRLQGKDDSDRVKIRGVVLEQTGGPLDGLELELAPPGPEEVLVRLRASGVCHSDWNASTGRPRRAVPPCSATRARASSRPSGPGSRASPSATTSRSRGRRGAASARSAARDLPQLCSTVWPAMGTGGLMDGTPRLSRDGEPVFHYSFLSTFAEACVVPERSCIPIPDDVPFDVAALVGCAVTTGVGAVWRTAGVRPGDRVAVIGCGGVGLSALMAAVAAGAEPVIAVDAAPRKARRRALVRRDGERRSGREAPRRPPRPCARPPAAASTTRSRRPDDPRRWRRRSSRRATRGAAVLIGIPRADAVLSLPAATIPRMERRILGSIYGSSKPERDFPRTLALYRRGRLPLDRLVSHRLPLEEAERGFELMQSGEALRVVLEL